MLSQAGSLLFPTRGGAILKALKSKPGNHNAVAGEQADYDLQIEGLIREISKRGSKLVGFQMPDGLKRYVPSIKERIEADTHAIPVFCTEPCFGACDVADSLADLGCDLIVHLGHSRMLEDGRIPVIYLPCFSKLSAREALESAIGSIPVRRVGLVSTLQHAKELPGLSRLLSDRGFEVHLGGPGPRTEHPGQVLGCNFRAARDVAADVDAFIYIGGGDFHPLGVALATGKEVYVVDPYAGETRRISPLTKRTLGKRFARIEAARGARSFGLLVSTKPGQRRIQEAKRCRELLASEGIGSAILSADQLDPARLRLYPFDAYVNFGCPRMAIEDSELFHKPVLTPPELEIVLGKRTWEEYAPDEIA